MSPQSFPSKSKQIHEWVDDDGFRQKSLTEDKSFSRLIQKREPEAYQPESGDQKDIRRDEKINKCHPVLIDKQVEGFRLREVLDRRTYVCHKRHVVEKYFRKSRLPEGE